MVKVRAAPSLIRASLAHTSGTGISPAEPCAASREHTVSRLGSTVSRWAAPGAETRLPSWRAPGAVPEEEVTEIRAKFLPMRRALGVAEDRIELKKPEVTAGSGDLASARRVEVTLQ